MAKRNTAKTARSSGIANPPRQRSMVWLQGLLCGAMVTLATPTALLLGVLLGPALLALVLDRQAGRPTARSIALCSMAASIEPLRSLWMADHSMATALALLGNLEIIGAAWSAAAGGWLLAEVMPIAVRAMLETTSRARAAHLRAARTRLMEEWRLDPNSADQ
ncbi:MAG TPA: hypothetical protein VMQ99_11150 [Acetobacteraceae bacterium]|nr:hypothetical protein [Acetobacteraceae bacterium]